MRKSYTFKLPLSLFIPRKTVEDRKLMLNINGYKKLESYDIANSKEAFKRLIQEQLNDCPIFHNKINIRFKIIKEYRIQHSYKNKTKIYPIIIDYLTSALFAHNKVKSSLDNTINLETLLPTVYKKKEKGKIQSYAKITITEVI
jgi:hypothetical protein